MLPSINSPLVSKSPFQRALDQLAAKRRSQTLAFDHYNGIAKLRFSTDKLEEIFGKDARFTQNRIAPAINASLERIDLTRLLVPDNPELEEALNDAWVTLEMDRDEDNAELSLLLTGEAFIIVEPTVDGVAAYYNDPRLCQAMYDPSDPKRLLYVLKLWRDIDEYYTAVMYYPNERISYRSRSRDTGLVGISESTFQEIERVPMDGIPVAHIRYSKPVVVDLIPPQDAISKVVSDMMVVGETLAFPLRVIFTEADTTELRNNPNSIWTLPSGDGVGSAPSVQQLPPSDLTSYLNVVDHNVNYIAVASSVPRHYLMQQGGVPSGEALITQESPLNKKVTNIINKQLSPFFARVAQLVLAASGVDLAVRDIVPQFTMPETVQPRTRAEITAMLAGAGYNSRQSAIVAGFGEDEARELIQVDLGVEL
jgi:hypothetical protein